MGTVWRQVKIGGGGFCTGMDISNDGATIVYRSDVNNAGIWEPNDGAWRNVIKSSSIPSSFSSYGYCPIGVYEIRVAPSNSNRLYMMFMSRVWRSDNRGHTWTDLGLSYTNSVAEDNANRGARYMGQRMAVDPANPDIVYLGMPGCYMVYDTQTANFTVGQTLTGGTSGATAVIMGQYDLGSLGYLYLNDFTIADFTALETITDGLGGSARLNTIGNSKGGVWRSFNAGRTWEMIPLSDIPPGIARDNNYPDSPAGHPAICFDPTSGTTNGRTNTIYVGSYGNGIYRSTNAGSTWAAMSGSPTYPFKGKVNPLDGFYYVTQNFDGSTANTLWRWNGSAWANITPAAPMAHIESVLLDRDTAGRIWAVNDGSFLILSTDKGATWNAGGYISSVTRASSEIPWLAWTLESHLSLGDCVFDQSDHTKVWLAEGIGVATGSLAQSGSPTSVTWTFHSKGIENLASNTIICPPNGAQVFAGWDRSCFTITSPETYPSTHSPTNDLAIRHAWDVDYATSNSSYIAYLSLLGNKSTYKFGYYSTDGGANWTAFSGSPGNNAGNIPIYDPSGEANRVGGCLAVSSPTNIVAVPSNNSLPWYTKDGGATWSEIVISGVTTTAGAETGFGGAYYNNPKMVCADRVAANTFYLFNYLTQGLYRSTNSGDTWTKMNSGNIDAQSATNTKLISVHGQQGHLFLAGGQQGSPGDAAGNTKLMRSTDGGATWTEVSALIQEPWCVAAGAAAPGQSYPAIYFVGWYNSIFGIWQSIDNCSTWTQIGPYAAGYMDWIDGMDADKVTYGTVFAIGTGSSAYYRTEAMQYGRL